MNLIYINELGPNFRGDNIYEFIFSDVDDAYGEDWDVEPAAGRPSPPKIDFIKKVGILKIQIYNWIWFKIQTFFVCMMRLMGLFLWVGKNQTQMK
jgi:hypothetical protein